MTGHAAGGAGGVRISDACRDVRLQAGALRAAATTAEAVLALDVYRRAVLKAIHLLKRAEFGGTVDPRDGSAESVCICPDVLDVLQTAHLDKRVTAYADQPEFVGPDAKA